MKKIITALVAVALGVTAQAASVNWGGAISSPDAQDPLLAGQQAALLWSDSAFTGPITSISAFTVGTTAANGGTIVDTYTFTQDNVGTDWSFVGTYTKTGDVNGYYAILVASADGKSASYMDMGQVAGTTAQSAPTSVQFNADWSDLTATLTQGGYTVAVAPEPTSGLLLLLGMAGLALKRKRA